MEKKTPNRILGPISRAEYDALPGVNFSTLKWMGVSPMHYRWSLTNEQKSPDLDLGSATHTAVLQPRKFMDEYAIQPETRMNDKGEEIKFVRSGRHWDEFQLQHKGKTVLTPAQHKACWDMSEAVRKHEVAASWILISNQYEVAVQWVDPVTGVLCKGFIDALSPDAITDLKTGHDPSPRVFANAAMRYGYDIQAAFYQDAIYEITGKLLTFRWIVAAKNPPLDLICYFPTDELIQHGRDKYRDYLAKLVECQETNEWPGMSPEPQTLDLPAWAREGDVAGDVLSMIDQEA